MTPASQHTGRANIEAPQDYYTGLIGYTVGGVPVPLSEHELVHKSILDELSSNGERPLRLFFKQDVEEFKLVIQDYHKNNSGQQAMNRLPRWTIEDVTAGVDRHEDAPLPPGKNARTK